MPNTQIVLQAAKQRAAARILGEMVEPQTQVTTTKLAAPVQARVQ